MARRHGWGGSPAQSEEEASDRIVAAAIELIAETNADVNMADVAKRLGVTRQTVYRRFANAEELMTAAAVASVGAYMDRVEKHLEGISDPAEAIVESMVFTLDDIARTPHIGLMLRPSRVAAHTADITSMQAREFGREMLARFDVDWEKWGFDDALIDELNEFVLRTMQSFFVTPGEPARTPEELRGFLRRWVGGAIRALSLVRTLS